MPFLTRRCRRLCVFLAYPHSLSHENAQAGSRGTQARISVLIVLSGRCDHS
jgi:hypothetical protein